MESVSPLSAGNARVREAAKLRQKKFRRESGCVSDAVLALGPISVVVGEAPGAIARPGDRARAWSHARAAPPSACRLTSVLPRRSRSRRQRSLAPVVGPVGFARGRSRVVTRLRLRRILPPRRVVPSASTSRPPSAPYPLRRTVSASWWWSSLALPHPPLIKQAWAFPSHESCAAAAFLRRALPRSPVGPPRPPALSAVCLGVFSPAPARRLHLCAASVAARDTRALSSVGVTPPSRHRITTPVSHYEWARWSHADSRRQEGGPVGRRRRRR